LDFQDTPYFFKIKITSMAQVKFRSVALLTGGIFALLFFHFVPVGLSNVTIVGKSNQETAAEIIDENTAIARATKQGSFEAEAKHANVRSVIASSVNTSFYVVPAQTSYLKIKMPKKTSNVNRQLTRESYTNKLIN
jgi:hypothetical protein